MMKSRSILSLLSLCILLGGLACLQSPTSNEGTTTLPMKVTFAPWGDQEVAQPVIDRVTAAAFEVASDEETEFLRATAETTVGPNDSRFSLSLRVPPAQWYRVRVVAFAGIDPLYSGQTQVFDLQDGDRDTAEVVLSPLSTPSCFVSPPSLDFGTVFEGQTADRSFDIGNDGPGDVTINVSAIEQVEGGSCPEYRIVSGGGLVTLRPGEIRTVTIRFFGGNGLIECEIKLGSMFCPDVPCTGIGQIG